MIKLIASDLDGTLLQGGAQSLDPAVFDQIRVLKQHGIHFAAASGRQYVNLRRLFEPVQDEISYIAENGSLCIHNGETLSKSLIPRELGVRIVDAIHRCAGCDLIISGERVCYNGLPQPGLHRPHGPRRGERHVRGGQHRRDPRAFPEDLRLQL